jgi:hypothetical protein
MSIIRESSSASTKQSTVPTNDSHPGTDSHAEYLLAEIPCPAGIPCPVAKPGPIRASTSERSTSRPNTNTGGAIFASRPTSQDGFALPATSLFAIERDDIKPAAVVNSQVRLSPPSTFGKLFSWPTSFGPYAAIPHTPIQTAQQIPSHALRRATHSRRSSGICLPSAPIIR